MPTRVVPSRKKKKWKHRGGKKGKGKKGPGKNERRQPTPRQTEAPLTRHDGVDVSDEGSIIGAPYTAEDVFEGRNLHELATEFLRIHVDFDAEDGCPPVAAEVGALLSDLIDSGEDPKWRQVCEDLSVTPKEVVGFQDEEPNVLAGAPACLMWEAAQMVMEAQRLGSLDSNVPGGVSDDSKVSRQDRSDAVSGGESTDPTDDEDSNPGGDSNGPGGESDESPVSPQDRSDAVSGGESADPTDDEDSDVYLMSPRKRKAIATATPLESSRLTKRRDRTLKALDTSVKFKHTEGVSRRRVMTREYVTKEQLQEAQRVYREEARIQKEEAQLMKHLAAEEATRTLNLAEAFWGDSSDNENAVEKAPLLEQLDQEFPPEQSTMDERESTEYSNWLDNLEATERAKFLDMEEQASQITGLRYLAGNSSLGRKGYYGRVLSAAGNEAPLRGTLNPVWVRLNFRKEFLVKLRQHPRKWWPIPAGAPSSDWAPQHITTLVPTSHQQGDKPDCVFCSFASALDYVGMHGCAAAVSCAAPAARGQPLQEQVYALCRVMEQYGKPIGRPRQMGKRTKKGKKSSFTLQELLRTRTIYPTLVVPQASDGGIEHAVTVVDDLVFDSTQPTALKLTCDTLDWACSGRCVGIFSAWRFECKFATSTSLTRHCKSNW